LDGARNTDSSWDHEREQHDVYGGDGGELHGDGDGITDANADGNRSAAEWCDVQRQRERDGDARRDPGIGERG